MRQDDPRQSTTRLRFTVLAFLCVLSFLTYYDRQCRFYEDWPPR